MKSVFPYVADLLTGMTNNDYYSKIEVLGHWELIFGARMGGGCTSGHMLSGGMKHAVSSLTYAVFTFAGI